MQYLSGHLRQPGMYPSVIVHQYPDKPFQPVLRVLHKEMYPVEYGSGQIGRSNPGTLKVRSIYAEQAAHQSVSSAKEPLSDPCDGGCCQSRNLAWRFSPPMA